MKNGFTLVELMIVVIIISIIAAVAIPAFAPKLETQNAQPVETEHSNLLEHY